MESELQRDVKGSDSPKAPLLDTAFVQRHALEAKDAILAFWDNDRSTFWRSSEQRAREEASHSMDFYPTVTLRCVDALLLLALARPEWLREREHTLLFDTILPTMVRRAVTELRSSLDVGDRLNLFTLSLYVGTFSSILHLNGVATEVVEKAKTHLESACRDMLANKTLSPRLPTAHPFILYHASSALIRARLVAKTSDRKRMEKILDRIYTATEQSVERLLAKHSAASLNPSQSVALAFSAAILSLSGSNRYRQYIPACVDVCFDAQSGDGCWPLGRVVREHKDITSDRLEVSTYEITAIVAEVVRGLVRVRGEYGASSLAEKYLPPLLLAGRYTSRSIVRLQTSRAPVLGWCTEHAFGTEHIESWTSANVLTSAIRLHQVADEFRRRSILRTFTFVTPADQGWPTWLKWDQFRATSETDHANPILNYIEEKIIQPILRNPRNEPPLDPRSVSALLFGPPGTSKTTLVKAVADALDWPLVLLSPGDFIARGLEYIEAQSRSVFDRLLQLSRAVVLFDECDELFRSREPQVGTEQLRGITAFITASMLPKLQELHDRGRVLYFICTNNFETVDSAIKRGGRIDHIIGLGPPDKKARRHILTSTASTWTRRSGDGEPEYLSSAIDELVGVTERFVRSELQRAFDLLRSSMPWDSEEGARTASRNVAEKLEGGLTISTQEWENYKKLRNAYSHPVTERRARARR